MAPSGGGRGEASAKEGVVDAAGEAEEPFADGDGCVEALLV